MPGSLFLILALADAPAVSAPIEPLASARSPATARAITALPELRADTEAATFALEYLAATRGRFGATLPLVGTDRSPWRLTLSPVVELHNDPAPDGVLPAEHWRGRFSLDLRWSPASLDGHLELALRLEHESDHTTARFDDDAEPWFLSLNDAALDVGGWLAAGPLLLAGRLAPRLYVISCTVRGACDPDDGTTTVGVAADATVTSTPAWAGVRPFASLHGAAIIGRGLVRDERRAVLHVGAWLNAPRVIWQLYAIGFAGNEVGLYRDRIRYRVGVGARASF